MAKRIVKWSLDGTILKLSKPLSDPKSIAVIEAEFDLVALFPDFANLTDVQKQLIVYGTKQKLMDTGASDIGDSDGKVKSAKSKWAELLEGKWTGDRINSTGAAENKRIVNEVKTASQVISLQGLLLKKVAYPDKFTADDEIKLNEFLVIEAKNASKMKKG